jgi:hypothetical protein
MAERHDLAELTPTPVGERRSTAQAWDEATRPTRIPPSEEVDYTRRGRAAAGGLKQVHNLLRRELEAIQQLIDQVGRGDMAIVEAQKELRGMTMRQNNWSLGAYCASYCSLVAAHHHGEDTEIFPTLRAREPALTAVLDRLQQEHRVIHHLLDEVDRGLVDMVSGSATTADLAATVDRLTDALLSHLAYEEMQLLEAFARYYS